MLNYEHYKNKRLLVLIIFLGLQTQSVMADKPAEKVEQMKAENETKKLNELNKMDEDFLIFLAEVDNQNGVEIDPLDMLTLELDENSDTQETILENSKVKPYHKIEKPEENK